MLSILFDTMGFVGMFMLGYGLWLVYPPAMFIGIGGLLIIFAIFSMRDNMKQPNQQPRGKV